MKVNPDYITEDEKKKILAIKRKRKQPLYEIGKRCEVGDKGYWSKILNGKKPVPYHVRLAIIKLFQEED